MRNTTPWSHCAHVRMLNKPEMNTCPDSIVNGAIDTREERDWQRDRK